MGLAGWECAWVRNTATTSTTTSSNGGSGLEDLAVVAAMTKEGEGEVVTRKGFSLHQQLPGAGIE